MFHRLALVALLVSGGDGRHVFNQESHDDLTILPKAGDDLPQQGGASAENDSVPPQQRVTSGGPGTEQDTGPTIRHRRKFHFRPAQKPPESISAADPVAASTTNRRCDAEGNTVGDGMLFFTFWTTSQESYDKNRRMQRSIESVFYHHPFAEVVVFSDTLSNDTASFQTLLSLGCQVSVRPIQADDWFKGTPLEQWDVAAAKTGRYFYSHVTDALRFAVLYHTGGIYFDTDIIFLRPVDKLVNVVGHQKDVLETFLHVPSDLVGADANGALMIFHRHHHFVERCMQEFVQVYDPTVWDCVGPKLIQKIIDEAQSWPHTLHAEENHVTVMPPEAFYPSDWPRWLLYEVDCKVAAVVPKSLDLPLSEEINGDLVPLSGDQMQAHMKLLQSNSYAYHFWNRFSHSCPAEQGSVFQHLLNAFCMMCDDVVS